MRDERGLRTRQEAMLQSSNIKGMIQYEGNMVYIITWAASSEYMLQL